MRSQRFQNKIVAGRFTLPVTILIVITCWIVAASLFPNLEVQKYNYLLWDVLGTMNIPSWLSRVLSFLLYSIIGYLLIEFNNAYAIIRMRASVQTSIYLLLIAACPSIHLLYAGDVATVAMVIALSFLFKSYQQMNSSSCLFQAFTFLGMGSLLFPQLTLFAPIFWIGAYNFQSLNLRSFFASLTGWFLPYWILLGYAYYTQQMNLFYQPFTELATFAPIEFHLQLWEVASLIYLLILFIASVAHSLVAGNEDKMRTRSFLHFLILLTFYTFLFIGLQPALLAQLFPLLLVGVSILTGHLFVLTNSASYNIFFICMLVGLFTLFVFNVWTI